MQNMWGKYYEVTFCPIAPNRVPNERSHQELSPDFFNWLFIEEVITRKLVRIIGPLPVTPVKSLLFGSLSLT